MAENQQVIVDTKVLLLKCFVAEERLALFLMQCVNEHGSSFSVEEALSTKQMVASISSLLQEIKASYERPPDKLPVYLVGGVGYPPTFCLVVS